MQPHDSYPFVPLHALCLLVNHEAYEYTGIRNTCILSAATLTDVLAILGVPARMLRVTATVFPLSRDGYAHSLGSFGDGTRRPAASRGSWHGHVAVIVDSRVLLDPSLDQIDGAEPFISEISDGFLSGTDPLWSNIADGRAVRYHAHPNRCGWKGASAFRPSYRREVVAAVLADIDRGITLPVCR